MTIVWIYIDTRKQVGDKDHIKAFASEAAAAEHGAFAYPVKSYRETAFGHLFACDKRAAGTPCPRAFAIRGARPGLAFRPLRNLQDRWGCQIVDCPWPPRLAEGPRSVRSPIYSRVHLSGPLTAILAIRFTGIKAVLMTADVLRRRWAHEQCQ